MVFPVKSKVFVFKNIADGDKVLFLYDSKLDKQEAVRAFVKAGLSENKGVFYSYAFVESAVELGVRGNLRIYEMGIKKSVAKAENTLQNLSRALEKFLIEHKRGAAVLDFDTSPGYLLRREFISVLEDLFGRFPEATFVTCFNVEAVDSEFLEQILRLYSLVVVSADAEKTVIAPLVVSGEAQERRIEIISAEITESLVKKFLDLIILSILMQEPMHGYNIIKTIFHRYGVLVSQGMVYPLLHELAEEGLIKQESFHKGRGKMYVITSKGKEVARARFREFSDSLRYLLSVIGGSSMSP